MKVWPHSSHLVGLLGREILGSWRGRPDKQSLDYKANCHRERYKGSSHFYYRHLAIFLENPRYRILRHTRRLCKNAFPFGIPDNQLSHMLQTIVISRFDYDPSIP